MASYDHQSIEKKWQQRWEDTGANKAVESSTKPKRYVLDMFPYPSGAGLHVGHPIGYIATDIISRTWRMQGFNVLHPMGWDAFGLPAENFAIKTGVHPAVSTKQNIDNFRRQMKMLGLSYDWSREISTCDPAYYKWTQWMFLELYKNGLAYKKKAPVNWCEKDQTVLANEQVVDGCCERCGTPVVQKELSQWFFGITKYADRLLAGLDKLDWPEKIKAMQKNWIGKSAGAEISFGLPAGKELVVFTTRPDTLMGVSYVVLSPEHALVDELTIPAQKKDMDVYRLAAKGKSELERTQLEKDKSGVFTGSFATHPITGEPIPVWVSDYVLTSYGTGAVMGVPAHDERDFTFAKKYDLPMKQVIAPLIELTGICTPRADKETSRKNVVTAIIRHAKTGKYLLLKMIDQRNGFVGGGIDGKEDPETAMRREIIEETGYKNIKVHPPFIGSLYGYGFKPRKDVNCFDHDTVFTADVLDDERVASEDGDIHDVLWLDEEEVASHISLDHHKFMWQMYQDKSSCFTGDGILVNSGDFNGLKSEEAEKKIVEALEKINKGKSVTKFRLRDWLVSRQRYWGAPIPIVYDPEGKMHAVDAKFLPLELPTDVDYLPKGTSPIGSSKSYVELAEKLYGKGWRFETDTMDTFVDSSWYFLRFCDPQNTDAFADRSKVDYWCPVDMYVGGAEHAVLHLLYARFFTYALKDFGYVGFEEPFTALRNQGLILGPDGQKMSKSKGNVINPDDIAAQFGSDALRLYEMFMGEFEAVKPWDTKGITGVRRFLDKVWNLREKVGDVTNPTALRAVHKAVKKVSEDIVAFRFNTAVSTLMICANTLQEMEKIPTEAFEMYVRLLSPFAPHVAEELWSLLGHKTSVSEASWPMFDANLAKDDIVELAIQVNGKLRGTLSVSPDVTEDVAKQSAMSEPNVAKYLEGKTVVKMIFVPGKLVNFVVKD